MKIRQLFDFVEGEFDTENDKIICVADKKHLDVQLCFKSNMHIPFAEIRLFTDDRNAEEVFEDAKQLGDEICKRWNENNNLKNK